MRVGLVHDWLFGMRGGEHVLEALLELFPRAEIYTLFYDPKGIWSSINRRPIHASPLSKLPLVKKYYRYLLPLFPWTMGRLNVRRGLELIVSTSHCAAHGVRAPGGAFHLNYCLSPMRYIYDQSRAYSEGGSAIGTAALRFAAPALRRWDRKAARRCSSMVCISNFVAERIERAYGRSAPVIYPPVRTDFFTPSERDRTEEAGSARGGQGPYLIVSALAPYKRIDVAIEAANRLKKELIVVGDGPLGRELRSAAGPTVEFLGWVEAKRLRRLYRDCAALIFPGEEDFGIVPLEAMACGRPILALRAGGLLETHAEGVTGAFFDTCEPQCLAAAWERFEPSQYDSARIRVHAERFSQDRFMNDFALELAGAYARRRDGIEVG